MKFCENCHIQFSDDNTFCTNCGSSLYQIQPQQSPKEFIQQGKENKTAKTLHTVGVLVIVFGIIGFFIMGGIFPSITYDYSYYSGYDIDETYNWALTIVSFVVCFISGICFIGLSEIIKLLQENIYQQNTIIKSIKNQTTSKENL